MTFPKKITIGGFDWDISHSRDVAEEGHCFAAIHFRSLKIIIDPASPIQKQEEALLHEIMHACAWQCGLERRFSNKEIVSEEDVIQPLSMALYPVLKNLGYLNLLKKGGRT